MSVGKMSACAASVHFLSVRRVCSLAGTIFSSGFLVVQPVTGKIPCVASETALPAEFRRAEPLCKGACESDGLCLQVVHASKPPACRAAVTSTVKSVSVFRMPDTLVGAGQSEKGDR